MRVRVYGGTEGWGGVGQGCELRGGKWITEERELVKLRKRGGPNQKIYGTPS